MDEKGNIVTKDGRFGEKIFEQLVSTLLNKENGVLVVNDELIASRVEDVESKSMSNRKLERNGM